MLRSGCNDASFIPSDGVHLFERWRPSMDQGSTHRNKWFSPKPGRMDDDIELINSEFGLTFRSCYFRKTARPFWYFGDGMMPSCVERNKWASKSSAVSSQKYFRNLEKNLRCWVVSTLFTIKSTVSLHVHGVSWWPNPKKLQHFSSHFGPKKQLATTHNFQVTNPTVPGDETLDLLFIHGTWGACLRHVNTFWKLRIRADGWEVPSHNWWHWKIYLKMTIKNANNHQKIS